MMTMMSILVCHIHFRDDSSKVVLTFVHIDIDMYFVVYVDDDKDTKNHLQSGQKWHGNSLFERNSKASFLVSLSGKGGSIKNERSLGSTLQEKSSVNLLPEEL